MNPTLYNPKTNIIATPNANTTAEQYSAAKQQGFTNSSPVIDKTFNADSVSNVNPLVIPDTSKTNITTGLYQANFPIPSGTTIDANGNAIINQKKEGNTTTDTSQKSTFQTVLEKLGMAGNVLDTKASVTKQLQDEQQLALKTEQATKDYNAYNQKKTQYQQQIESMYSKSGGTTAGNQQSVADFSRRANADLANLAIQSQSSQGLLTAAQQTIKDKLDAQFQPVQEQIDFLSKFAQLNANDLTEKEKFTLQQQEEKKKTELAATQKIATDLHQAVLDNGNPPGVLSELDKVTHDYEAGNITANEAQSRYYQAAGKYGGDILDTKYKQAQIDKTYAEIEDKKAANSVINKLTSVDPNSPTYLQDVLKASAGGAKMTGDQIAPISKALTVVGQIDSLQSTLQNADTGPILGVLRSNNPYDVQAGLIKAQLQALIPNLARGVYGEVGVLTDNDIANYRQTIGNLKSPKELNDLLLSMTLKTVKNGIADRLEVNASAGRDVSGFKNLVTKLDSNINQIDSRLGVNNSQNTDKTTSPKIDRTNVTFSGLNVTLPDGSIWTAPTSDALNKFKIKYGL